jgi:hypothetical protein
MIFITVKLNLLFDGNKYHTNLVHHTHNGMDRLNFNRRLYSMLNGTTVSRVVQ